MSATPEFFNVQPVRTALDALFALWTPQPRHEMRDPRDALGCVLAAEPRSPIDLPEFARSTVDGYAVRAADTFGASQSLPAYLTCVGSVAMGERAAVTVGPAGAAEIHTGGMLPQGADAVVMIERTQMIGEGELEVLAPVAPGENVIQIGSACNAPSPSIRRTGT
ncbi:MAG: molybdopterin molybdenumtransferase MoeA, partial [Anaerolineae bacterium]|nr:molybdopterin molybdenumtransferase MoeA [Anaerolineae bacterium]